MNIHRYVSFPINIIIIGAIIFLGACSGQGSQSSSKLTPTLLSSDFLNKAFSKAAQEYKVPRLLLLAIGYVESQWQTNLPGLEGIMGLYSNGRNDSLLSRAASLTGETKDALISDPATNIRGAAAILAADSGGALDNNLNAWYGAVIRYISLPYKEPTGWYIVSWLGE
jgi:soluble lytic murein transglycosylase-like protein